MAAGRKAQNPDRGAKTRGSILLHDDSWEAISAAYPDLSTSAAIQQIVDAYFVVPAATTSALPRAGATPSKVVVRAARKRVPKSLDEFIAEWCARRGVTTPSVRTRIQLKQEYEDYLEDF